MGNVNLFKSFTIKDRHSGPDFYRDKLQPESRVSGGNRNPVYKLVPDFHRDDAWMPDQVRHDKKDTNQGQDL